MGGGVSLENCIAYLKNKDDNPDFLLSKEG